MPCSARRTVSSARCTGAVGVTATSWAPRPRPLANTSSAGYYREGGTPEASYRWLAEETEGRVRLWLYCWVPQEERDIARDLAVAESVGTGQILFWEADQIDLCPAEQRQIFMEAMRHAARPQG